MPDSIKKAARWLGLVEDSRYDYDEVDGELTEEVFSDADYEPSQITPLPERRSSGGGATAVATASSQVVGQSQPKAAPVQRTADLTRIITVHPRTYNEARTIGEHFRDSVPVIMNLSDMEDADAKRLVDFAAGLIFGLRGTIERVTSKVFLLSPQNVNVTAEDKERIAAGGFFNQS
ncbi:cell division protein SepF [Luteococcus peritonei]|uniref:Cell division protein SepF n=1 Tax=Luteococcus peritonei TaxID=88874 RepID=A0ABW4RTB1_9ACTN